MPWRGPEYDGEFPSLGRQVVEFYEAAARVPAGPMYGQPIVLTADQVAWFMRLYRLTHEGELFYRRACRMGPKGKGKSPEGALFCFGEFAGPVVFAGWDANGEPVGRPRDYPWVQVAACSEEQDHNLYGPLREMVAESPMLDELGIDLGKTRIEFRDGRPGKIEPVSASAGAREGQPITAAALEESGLWMPSKGGVKLAAVLRRNVGKTNGRSVEFTNPPALGEGSVAENTLVAADKGERGLLLSWAQGTPVENPKDPANRDAVMASLAEAYDDGTGHPVPWINLERQYAECLDSDVPEADVFRFYLALARKTEDRAFDPAQFDPLAVPTVDGRPWWSPGFSEARLTASPVDDDEPVLLAFDGARTRDCAVFTAWTLGDKPHHFHVASWSRPPNPAAGYQHPRGEIAAVARDFLASHRCALFAFDESFHELDSLYADWVDEWGEADGKGRGLMAGFPTATGARMQKALAAVQEDVRAGLVSHDGDEFVAEHVHNAVAVKNRGGWTVLGKPKETLHIDAAVTFTFGHSLIPAARAEADAGSVVVLEGSLMA